MKKKPSLFAALALCAFALVAVSAFGFDTALAAPLAQVAPHIPFDHFATAMLVGLGAVHDANSYERGREYGKKDAGSGGDDDIVGLRKKLGEITEKVREFATDVKGRMEKGEQLSNSQKEKIDETLLSLGEVKTKLAGFEGIAERLADLEQKAARHGRPENEELRKSLGELVVDSKEFKESTMTSSSRKAMRVQMSRKDVTNANATVGTGRSPGTSLNPADRQPGIVTPPTRKMTVRDLLMPGETSQGSIEYVVETGFVNNAAPVAEGTTKPKSDITFDLRNQPVRTIAHIFKASRQILDDAPALRSYIDGRATYGLQFKEEVQFLSGDGTGQNVLGIIPQATPYAVPTGMATVANATAIDKLRIAVLQVALAEYPASAYILNPIDWATIELTKDAGGNYIIGNPQDGTTPTLWNLPVVSTQAIVQGRFLTGAFDIAAQVFDRMEIEVLLSTENVDDFEKNMMTIRAEERAALAVYRPEAFVTGTL